VFQCGGVLAGEAIRSSGRASMFVGIQKRLEADWDRQVIAKRGTNIIRCDVRPVRAASSITSSGVIRLDIIRAILEQPNITAEETFA